VSCETAAEFGVNINLCEQSPKLNRQGVVRDKEATRSQKAAGKRGDFGKKFESGAGEGDGEMRKS
jgi:hypothetical protein